MEFLVEEPFYDSNYWSFLWYVFAQIASVVSTIQINVLNLLVQQQAVTFLVYERAVAAYWI